MKKIIKSPLFYMAIAICLIAIGLYLFGFRITYNPELDNNWDAVSACAAWTAVFVAGIGSVISVYFAIQVPKKIAEEQNRIALFEKRYNLYMDFSKVLAFIKILETNEIKTKNEGVLEFVNFVGDNDFSDQDSGLVQAKAKSLLIKIVEKWGQVSYLFGLKSDELIEDYFKSLTAMVKAKNDNEFLKYLEESKKLFNKINEQMLPILESYLHI